MDKDCLINHRFTRWNPLKGTAKQYSTGQAQTDTDVYLFDRLDRTNAVIATQILYPEYRVHPVEKPVLSSLRENCILCCTQRRQGAKGKFRQLTTGH